MFKKKQLMLDMVDENGDFPISTASYEMGPQGIVFYKADICLDAKGNISKVSTGAKIPLMFNTIQPSDIEVGGFLGGGTSARVNEGIYKPSNYPVAVKTVNILDKEKRAQLLNDLKMLVCDPTKTLQVCPQLVQLYGAYYEEGNIKLILELMDVGSFRDVLNMRREILGSSKIEERVVSLVMQPYAHTQPQCHGVCKVSP